VTPDAFGDALNGILDRIHQSGPVYRAIADLMVSSAQQNFESEGRPNKWVPLSKATKKLKEKHGWTRILFRSGQLRASISPTSDDTSASASSNKAYAKIQQLGGTISVPEREGKARFRTNAKGQLLSQSDRGGTWRNAGSMRVFAKGTHKRAIEKAFHIGAYQIQMPSRPYLLFQPGERDLYTDIVYGYWMHGEIKKP